MLKKDRLRVKLLGYFSLISFGASLTGCGTVFYPERKGTISGEIDPVVAIANGIGLLFFIIPGVIAFAVDFTTGAIYLPRGKRAKFTQAELEQIIPNKQLDIRILEEYLSEKIKQPVSLNDKNLKITLLASEEEALLYLGEHQALAMRL